MLEYLLDAYGAAENFEYFDTDYCFVGHTHIPVIFKLGAVTKRVSLRSPKAETSHELKPRLIINPGSVGQPRDRDPRAAYAIYDSEQGRLYVYRVNYRVAVARRRILQAGLPPVLGDRLLYGA